MGFNGGFNDRFKGGFMRLNGRFNDSLKGFKRVYWGLIVFKDGFKEKYRGGFKKGLNGIQLRV